MKLNTTHSLIVCLILTVSYLTHIHAVTDAELEALEKQLEQVEEKQKLEEQQKRFEEKKRKLEEEKRKLEEARLIELERKRQEEETKQLALEEQKRMAEEAKRSINLKVFSHTGEKEQHPTASVRVPSEYKILGGGAENHWKGAGNLLTSSYPKDAQTWYASGKDHSHVSPSTITVWAIALHDPDNDWDVRIFNQTGQTAQHPNASITIPSSFVMTGGGAKVNWTGEGNLLTASFPKDQHSWEARSKDHSIASPGTITVYAIGIRRRDGEQILESKIFKNTGSKAQHPSVSVSVESGFLLTGGGARVNWTGAGNLLTSSYSVGDGTWSASSKDHSHVDSATITAYAIGLKIR
ncbi:MAG: cell envelope integrity protein TolA [Proteobacteria bacterium]|nr:cell envelope integrity protein TolA [Pseudomonadota bacterium]